MLMVRNSLSGKKEPFKPCNPPKVSLYACGVTTYDYCHIGHGMQAMIFEMIRSYLTYSGYEVRYVRNFTDVDDKIIARAATLRCSAAELSEEMVQEADKDFDALGIPRADQQPRVSQMIPEIISMIEDLIERDSAYSTPAGHVYYRVRSKKDYGDLSHRKVDELRHATRDVLVEDKEDPLDFALWKADSQQEFSWDSPWGRGRPGWHIECSVMSYHTLGFPLDIHGGGRDLLFPHHENERAQSESCYGSSGLKYANYWLHSGLLSIDGRKMSKSLGNHISIKDFLKQYSPEVLRLCLWEHHYRQDVDFSQETFASCERKLISYYELLQDLEQQMQRGSEEGAEEELKGLREQWRQAMDDDFNTPRVMALLHGWFKQLRGLLAEKESTDEKRAFLAAFSVFLGDLRKVLGLFTEEPGCELERIRQLYLRRISLTAEQLSEKINSRSEARRLRQWQLADEIRDELRQLGIVLKDSRDGSGWTVKGVDL